MHFLSWKSAVCLFSFSMGASSHNQKNSDFKRNLLAKLTLFSHGVIFTIKTFVPLSGAFTLWVSITQTLHIAALPDETKMAFTFFRRHTITILTALRTNGFTFSLFRVARFRVARGIIFEIAFVAEAVVTVSCIDAFLSNRIAVMMVISAFVFGRAGHEMPGGL